MKKIIVLMLMMSSASSFAEIMTVKAIGKNAAEAAANVKGLCYSEAHKKYTYVRADSDVYSVVKTQDGKYQATAFCDFEDTSGY